MTVFTGMRSSSRTRNCVRNTYGLGQPASKKPDLRSQRKKRSVTYRSMLRKAVVLGLLSGLVMLLIACSGHARTSMSFTTAGCFTTVQNLSGSRLGDCTRLRPIK